MYLMLSTMLGLVISPTLSANVPFDWDDYKKGYALQEQALYDILEEIDLTGKTVCHVGCGPGSITLYMAEQALFVRGMDQSPDKIKAARDATLDKLGNGDTNVTFQICAAENIVDECNFDVITAFFVMHWIKDKQRVLKNFYRALTPGGWTYFTQPLVNKGITINPVAIALQNILPELITQFEQMQSKSFQELTGYYVMEEIDLRNILTELRFAQVEISWRTIQHIFNDEDEIQAHIRPLIMPMPFMKLIPNEIHDIVIHKLTARLKSILKKGADNSYIYESKVTLIKAQKPA